jgi:hypothetical protein
MESVLLRAFSAKIKNSRIFIYTFPTPTQKDVTVGNGSHFPVRFPHDIQKKCQSLKKNYILGKIFPLP